MTSRRNIANVIVLMTLLCFLIVGILEALRLFEEKAISKIQQQKVTNNLSSTQPEKEPEQIKQPELEKEEFDNALPTENGKFLL